MKSGKKLISILLILVMAVFLFTGCGKKNEPDTTLEGTWRMTKIKVELYTNINGSLITKEEVKFPGNETGEESGVTSFYQPYLQVKNYKVTSYTYVKMEVSEEDKELYENLGEQFSLLLNGVVLGSDNEYSVNGNKIIIQEDKEATYKITGKTMTMTIGYIDDEDESYMKNILYFEKDTDSAVDNAIPFEEFYLEFYDEISNSKLDDEIKTELYNLLTSSMAL